MRASVLSLVRPGALLAAALALAWLANLLAGPSRRLGWLERPAAGEASSPASVPPAPEAPPLKGFPADPAQPIREITSQEAWGLFRSGARFLDARRTSDYLEGHVPGAWSVPVWEAEADARITEFEATARPGSADPLVVYCGGGNCEDSRLLAERILPLGYRNLLLYKDGFPDWIRQGRSLRKGDQP